MVFANSLKTISASYFVSISVMMNYYYSRLLCLATRQPLYKHRGDPTVRIPSASSELLQDRGNPRQHPRLGIVWEGAKTRLDCSQIATSWYFDILEWKVERFSGHRLMAAPISRLYLSFVPSDRALLYFKAQWIREEMRYLWTRLTHSAGLGLAMQNREAVPPRTQRDGSSFEKMWSAPWIGLAAWLPVLGSGRRDVPIYVSQNF